MSKESSISSPKFASSVKVEKAAKKKEINNSNPNPADLAISLLQPIALDYRLYPRPPSINSNKRPLINSYKAKINSEIKKNEALHQNEKISQDAQKRLLNSWTNQQSDKNTDQVYSKNNINNQTNHELSPRKNEKRGRATLFTSQTNFDTFMDTIKLDPLYAKKMKSKDSFIYLSPINGNTYNLKIVDADKVDKKNYFTLTVNGIIHILHGDTEYIPIEQFERGFSLYRLVSLLPFFQQYRSWKSFTTWKKNVRFKKIQDASEKLERNLFILNPLLCNSLIELRQLCQNIIEDKNYRLFNIQTGHTYSLDDFFNEQTIQKEAITLKFHDFSETVRNLVYSACESALKEFLELNGFVNQANQEPNKSKKRRSIEFKSTTNIPREISFTERAAMRTQCRKLSKYIRLCDFFVIDSFLSVALVCTKDLLSFIFPSQSLEKDTESKGSSSNIKSPPIKDIIPNSIKVINKDVTTGKVIEKKTSAALDIISAEENDKKYKALFKVEMHMNMDSRGMGEPVFSPKPENFKIKLETIIYDALKVVTSPLRLLTHEDLHQFVKPSVDEYGSLGEGMDLEMMIIEDQSFQFMVELINEKLSEAFDKADEYAKIFEQYIQKYLENESDLLSMNMENYQNEELKTFTSLILKYENQKQDFENIPVTSDIGIIRVDSDVLKSILLPSPNNCLSAINKLVPIIAQVKTQILLDEFSSNHEKISTVPINVDDFVTLTTNVNQVTEEMDRLDERYKFVIDIYDLMQKHSIYVSDEDNTTKFMLLQAQNALKTMMHLCDDKINENTQRFSKELDENIPRHHLKIEAAGLNLNMSQISDPDSDLDEVIKFLEKSSKEVALLVATAEKFSRYQEILKLPPSSWEDLEQLKEDSTLKLNLWMSYRKWGGETSKWKSAPFSTIDASAIEVVVSQYLKTISRSERGLAGNLLVPKFKSMVKEFNDVLPVVNSLTSKDLKDRHWQRIHDLVGFSIKGIEGFTLGQLIERQAGQYAALIETITSEAVQENVLEGMLEQIEKVWRNCDFDVMPYNPDKVKDVYILGSIDDIVIQLDESLVNITTILGSRYVGPIRPQVTEWQMMLLLFQETLEEWTLCQRTWMYLENIFSSPDMMKQLPKDTKMFESVDLFWKKQMVRTWEEPHALKAATRSGLKELFEKHNASLDIIQKNLEQFLETKRNLFPRFYFLSNDELLEILAKSKEVQAVQPHLKKCFDNLYSLDFGSTDKDATLVDIKAMISGEGERVPLGKNLKTRGSVEEWLKLVEKDMANTLHLLMKNAISEYELKPRALWVKEHAGQVVATVAQIMWSKITEETINSKNSPIELERWYHRNVSQLQDLTSLVRSKLTKLQRKVIVALVTTDVHARDIVETLWKTKVTSTQSFGWQQQLRMYWDRTIDDVVARQANSQIRYAYEYEGCTSRLVITPLTDRCWMTLTGAIAIKLGGAPAGPAGTGKTESSKDLAKALGIFCIVFNCSEQIDYNMMGKLFSGLCQAGCWTCLDEFNRIDIEVLSVIAQQLLIIRQGRLEMIPGEVRTIIFEGSEIKLASDAINVIITMNPGYAGRTELPDNLKVLFRPVSMMVPDYVLIAEIMLFAEGFDDARNLSRKMAKLYKLASEQLSQQKHYDYGLRAVKSVLVMAGGLKRNNPQLSEDVVLIRAMRDSNVPKFLQNDLALFSGILLDLFPGVEVPNQDTDELKVAIFKAISRNELQEEVAFVKKTIQLFETMEVRFGVTLVGATGSGKTTAYNILAEAITALRKDGKKNESFQIVRKNVLNPKCITMGELFGELNNLTAEWKDGLASLFMVNAVADESSDMKWIVFDGPIDALWIENMNTVLDDTMTLCLANSKRIKLKSEMRMVFEVQDLDEASPATVSRLGVIFLNVKDLGWLPIIETWATKEMKQVPPSILNRIMSHIRNYVQPGFDYIRKYCVEPITSCDAALAVSLTSVLRSIICNTNNFKFLETLPPTVLDGLVDKIFVFSYIWSIGGPLSPDDLFGGEKFNEFLTAMFEKANFNLDLGKYQFKDVFVKFENEGSFVPWETVVPPLKFDRKLPFFQLMVPTIDSVRYSYIIESLIKIEKPAFLTGITGTGKTIIIQDLLNKLSKSEEDGGLATLPIFIGFSARSSAKVTQLSIEGKLQKNRKNLLCPPNPYIKVVIVVDDVNMPSVEQYGAQPPIELLRQFLDFKGFYDRDKLFWKDIENTTMIACAAPPGGGRNAITPRFVRHFNLLCLPPTSKESIRKIFSAIVDGFLEVFLPPVRNLSRALVDSTIEVYSQIMQELLPIPAKCHYTFNLRDVGKVFQGILMVNQRVCSTPESLTKLWIHESMRVFHDRLINLNDKLWFTEMLIVLCNRLFKQNWKHEEIFENSNPIIWCHFLKPGSDDRNYEESKGLIQVVNLLKSFLEDYNATNSNKMNLVFFQDAVEHICRVTRVLRQPRGNMMLIGVGGSGKQSLTRLAASINEMKCYQIEIKKGYGVFEFKEDLKNMFMQTGVEGKSLVFLFNDTQILNEAFLEDINNILNTGEVPNLFAADEQDKIISDMRPKLKLLGISDTRDNCKAFFVERIREYLHVVLCMSPVGDSLRVRCRQFPSLINCCTIDWYMEWPRSALFNVAKSFLESIEFPSDDLRYKIAEMCVTVHTSLNVMSNKFFEELRRRVYTTPKSYLDLIDLYQGMLAEKREEIGTNLRRLTSGVTKLEETNKFVAELRGKLTKMQPFLIKKSEETEILLKQVDIEKNAADKVKEKVSQDESLTNQKAREVAAVQAEAQKELDVALPAMEQAVKSLDSLDKSQLTEVKSFPKPPPAVQLVMEAVNTLLAEKPDWDTAKKVLGDVHLLERLKGYNKDDIPQAILRKVRKYVEKPEMSVEAVRKVSTACASLCMWVHAMDGYARVFKEVEPKRIRLAEMNAQLESANATLAEKQATLKEIIDKVASLQRKCDQCVEEKNRLKEESEKTQKRLFRAEKLTIGLASEGVRWKESVENLTTKIQKIVGNVFMAAACISYYGAFTGVYREEIIALWMKTVLDLGIPIEENFSLSSTLSNPVQIREWVVNGLPSDSVSINNAILSTRGKRWPLMIDPQGQANAWIRRNEGKNLEITKMINPNLLTVLSSCIRLGKSLLIENIDETLNPAIEPILSKQTFKQGGRFLIRLGDADVDYDIAFKLFLSTKLPNPHYLPEVCIKVTIINFTVTSEGLEDQLLGEVVRKETPEVEERKNKLVASMANDRKQLDVLEKKILKLLSESGDDILDDEVLINTLADSKTTATDISIKIAESEKTEAEINVMRNQYRPVAIRASLIYFVIADLASIDPMYQYSLEYFCRLFLLCIDDSERSSILNQRLENIIKFTTIVTYSNICRGLFESHKLLFSFMVCTSILKDRGEISPNEWSLLLRGALLVDRSKQCTNPDPNHISEIAWDLLSAVEAAVPALFGLQENVANSYSEWKPWIDSDEPQNNELPNDWNSRANPFQKMLLLKVFRPEKVIFSVTKYVDINLGKSFTESPAISMEAIYNDTTKITPCIFILSSGADPTSILFRFADDKKYQDRLHVISLGQNQGPKAEKLIQKASLNGDWVLLQNCHLAKSWMQNLEKVILEFPSTSNSMHEDFRLFLTSSPALYFPVPVLQLSVKLTNEPPKGLRANILRSYSTIISNSALNSCSKPDLWRKMIFSLAFFHAVVQERRKFGPLGWNIRYDFNDSDLETSIEVLRNFLDEQLTIPWDALKYVTGEINYGGRVTDDWDRRTIMSILNKFYDPQILSEQYKFSESGTYFIPPVSEHLGFIEYIQELPSTETPEIYGMHSNANILFQIHESNNLINTILSVQPRVTGNSTGISPDDVVVNLALEIEKNIPPNLMLEDAGRYTFVVKENDLLDSLATVLQQEIQKFNKLLDQMRNSLRDLQKAIKGFAVMSADLDRMFVSFINNQVPLLWSNVAYPSLKPLASWVKDLIERVAFFRSWLVNGPPSTYPLPVFFFPQGFMTGVLQVHARKYKLPINCLDFEFSIFNESVENISKPVDGVVIFGLWMEGARWDREKHRLADSHVGIIHSQMPPIHFLPKANHKQNAAHYSCPVYKTGVRAGQLSTTGLSTNFVLSVDLPTNLEPDYWVWR